MIIISSGFPKSASTLLFLYTEHLLKLSGRSRGQRMFRNINKEGFTPHFGLLNTLWYIFASCFGPVVIKTHAGPSFFIRLLLAMRLARAYYSIRDPRDVVLSAMDHAEKARKKTEQSDSDKAFAPFKTWDDLFPALDMHFSRYHAWKKDGRVLFVRYEALMKDPSGELTKVVQHIGLPGLIPKIPETVQWFASRKNETVNFNKGQLARYTTELSPEEISRLERRMKDVIVAMDYPLNQTV